MIQEALEQRTAMLRSNPAELEAFMMQVGIWKRQAEIAAGLDTRPSFIARNRKEAVQDAGLKIQQQVSVFVLWLIALTDLDTNYRLNYEMSIVKLYSNHINQDKRQIKLQK